MFQLEDNDDSFKKMLKPCSVYICKLSETSDNTNQNVDKRPLSKRKKKSAFNPYYVYYSSTLSRKPLAVTQPSALKRFSIKEDCSKSVETKKYTDHSDIQSKIQRETREIASKELKLNDCIPKINNAKAEVEPQKFNASKRKERKGKERKTVRGYVYTSTFIDGRIRITKKLIHPKTDHKKSEEIKELVTRHVETQTIDVVEIKNEAQVISEVSDAGVQTDLQTRNELCDFSCQTVFPDAISESLSSVKELRHKISELEQNLAQTTAMYERKMEGCERCSGRCNESTVQSQTSLSSLHGTQNMLRPDTIELINSLQLPASVTISPVPNSFIPRQPRCITSMCASKPKTSVTIVPQQLIEEDNFPKVLSPRQSTPWDQRYFQQQQARPLQSSVVNTRNESRQQQNCACKQCFQRREPPLLQNISISVSSGQSRQYQSLHHKQLRRQRLTQHQLMKKYQQQMRNIHILRQDEI